MVKGLLTVLLTQLSSCFSATGFSEYADTATGPYCAFLPECSRGPLFKREHSSGVYSSTPHFLSNLKLAKSLVLADIACEC